MIKKTLLHLIFALIFTGVAFTQDMYFLKNGRFIPASDSGKYIVYENDVCEIIVKNEGIDVTNYRLEVLEEQELKSPVKFNAYTKMALQDSCKFFLTGLKPNKLINYQIKEVIPGDEYEEEKKSLTSTFTSTYDSLKQEAVKMNLDTVYKIETSYKNRGNDTVTLKSFVVEVHEITHIEGAMGLVYSNLEYNSYELTTVPGDTAGAKKIVNNGTANRLDFTLGAIIRPWGYDQRGELWDPRNTYLYFGLGFGDKGKVFENIYLGLGYGYRAFNFTAGVHLSSVKELIYGYEENKLYKKSDIDDIKKVITSKFKANFFAGVLIDFSIFSKVFSKIL